MMKQCLTTLDPSNNDETVMKQCLTTLDPSNNAQKLCI